MAFSASVSRSASPTAKAASSLSASSTAITPSPRPSFPYKIYILLFEGADEEPIKKLAPELEKIFDFRVEIIEERLPLPIDAYKAGRKQYSATGVLEEALKHAPADAARILAIFPADIFIGRGLYNYGFADPDNRGAIVATARLQSGEPMRYYARLLRVSEHELAHTFTLEHCSQEPQNCVMPQSSELMQLDGKSIYFCGTCRAKLIKAIRKTKEELLEKKNAEK